MNDRYRAVVAYNRDAWNHLVCNGNRWTLPVSAEVIQRARRGDWQVVLTPERSVPRDWFPELAGCRVLCLASGGGQQSVILAAAGARVTVLDLSPRQLAQDQDTAAAAGLDLTTIEGDMTQPLPFEDESFDVVFHPCSNSFIPDVRHVWRECYRVLKSSGVLLTGFVNPCRYLFDENQLQVRYSIPYSDEEQRPPEILETQKENHEPLEFGHTLDDQIGGQLAAGFLLDGFFEDRHTSDDPISEYIATFIATRARKL